jgi:hypothetical protein
MAPKEPTLIPKVSEDQQNALDAQPDIPLRIVDPRTNTTYVLLPLQRYEKIKALFEEDPMSDAEKRLQLAESARRAGWDDPEMDVYDNYDAHRPTGHHSDELPTSRGS